MFSKKSAKSSPRISLLIPFGGKDSHRRHVLDWLIQYWKHQIPNAEIIIGRSFSKPFCKTEAFNNAAKRATGDIFVLLDADAYMPGLYIERAAYKIRYALEQGHHLWFVPYRKLYRLTESITEEILRTSPANPFVIPNPPPNDWIDGDPSTSSYGRRYGAMIMVIPRQAYEVLGGFDERFSEGWGGEDASILRALDTLWGKHKSLNTAVFHLWHPQIGVSYREKKWPGQKHAHPHDKLATKYHKATGRPSQMRRLVDEGRKRGLRRKLLIIIDILFFNRILSERK